MKSVTVIVPSRDEKKAADIWRSTVNALPLSYEHIELDKFKTSYRRLDELDHLLTDEVLIETTDVICIYKLRAMRKQGLLDKLTICTEDGVFDISDEGRYPDHTIWYEIENKLDEFLGVLVS